MLALALAGLGGILSARCGDESGQPVDRVPDSVETAGAEVRYAYLYLLTAESFIPDTHYGDGTAWNEAVGPVRTLAATRDADILSTLVSKASPAGKVYALCALAAFDRENAATLAATLDGDALRATVIHADQRFTNAPLGPYIDYTADAKRRDILLVRLRDGQSLEQWRAENRDRIEQKGGYRLDILGGGIPALLIGTGEK